MGHISGQGNNLLRSLLVEAAHIAVRFDPGWKRHFLRLGINKGRQVAIVAIARRLALRLWWMWRGLDYPAMVESGSHAE